MKLVASIITITTREDFYLWLEKLPTKISKERKLKLAEMAKYSTTAFWSTRTRFKFW